ncbi:hypothetical protein HY256_11895 [Candidatus Sumerlaeota bacterium]|nr:hypothetical protein [Candidatus Sumerlaeota bacterium]
MRLGIAGESFRAANDVVFPEEPIGAGAKWSMEIRVPIDGLDFNSRTVFQLTKVDNDLLSIVSELKGESLAKEVKMDNTAPGSRIEVQQMKFAGNGESQVRLSQGFIPVASSFKINLDSKLKMSAPPDRIIMMTQKVLMECKVKSINNPNPALSVPQNPPPSPKK